MDDDAFGRFAAERRPALLGTALLLTGDRGSAEELVQRALTRARRSGDPAAAVLPALVRGATSRWARLTRGEQVIESLPDPSADSSSGQPDLARALRELPPALRTVVVLRWHERLADPQVAELLRRPVAAVAADAAAGLDRLRPALRPSVYERADTDVPVEDRLAEELRRLARAPGSWRLDPAGSVADVRSRRRGTRRRLAAGAAVAVCAVGIAVPLARWAPDPPASPAAPPAASPTVATATPPPIAPRATPVLTGPTRGSLAGDPAFLDEVRTVGWGGLEPPPPADREVVFAGDTPHGRVVLVVGTVLEDFRGVWLLGPVGAAADQLVPRLPASLGRDRPVTLLLGGPGPASLVVVAGRGDEITVSDRLMTGPRGTVGRTYVPVDSVDGVAVVPARTTAAGPALSVRVARDGRQVFRSAVDWAGTRSAGTAPLPALTPLRPASAAAEPHVLDAALTELAVALGVEPPVLLPELLWAGDLPSSRVPGTVVVVVARSPGGALVVTTWAGTGTTAWACGAQTPPGTTDVATLTIARVCEVPGVTGGDGTLVVTAPADAASAELLDSRDRVLGPLALQDGSTVVPLPPGARTVRTLDADGRPLRETPIAPPPGEPFGDFGNGPER